MNFSVLMVSGCQNCNWSVSNNNVTSTEFSHVYDNLTPEIRNLSEKNAGNITLHFRYIHWEIFGII